MDEQEPVDVEGQQQDRRRGGGSQVNDAPDPGEMADDVSVLAVSQMIAK